MARRCGRLLSVFHNRRWDSDFLTLKSLINEGLLGEVGYFESHFDRYRPEVRNRWREQGGPGSGIWYDLGPHLLDQVVNLFGLPVSISVDLAQLRPAPRRPTISTPCWHILSAGWCCTARYWRQQKPRGISSTVPGQAMLNMGWTRRRSG